MLVPSVLRHTFFWLGRYLVLFLVVATAIYIAVAGWSSRQQARSTLRIVDCSQNSWEEEFLAAVRAESALRGLSTRVQDEAVCPQEWHQGVVIGSNRLCIDHFEADCPRIRFRRITPVVVGLEERGERVPHQTEVQFDVLEALSEALASLEVAGTVGIVTRGEIDVWGNRAATHLRRTRQFTVVRLYDDKNSVGIGLDAIVSVSGVDRMSIEGLIREVDTGSVRRWKFSVSPVVAARQVVKGMADAEGGEELPGIIHLNGKIESEVGAVDPWTSILE